MLIARRRLFTGIGAAWAAALLARFPGARLIRAQGASYEMVDLWAFEESIERPGGGSVTGFGVALNDAGTVAGSLVRNGKLSPAIWTEPGSRTLLESGRYGAAATAINNEGIAVGAEFDEELNNARPILWRDGQKVTLGLPDGAGGDIRSGSAEDINDEGVAVGIIVVNEHRYAMRWTGDLAEELPPMRSENTESFGEPRCINNDGVVVGTASVFFEDAETSGFVLALIVWRDEEPEIIARPEEVAPMDSMFVADLSNTGLAIVSYTSFESGAASPSYVVDVESGETTRLAALSDAHTFVRASSINDDGVIVGYMRAGTEPVVPAIWVDGEPLDLNNLVPSDSGIRLIAPSVINNQGVILCSGVDEDDVPHMVLLVPAG